MDDKTTGVLTSGITGIIGRCFESVFDGLNVATEAWFQKTKLMTVCRDKYSSYIADRVGTVSLFACSRSARIDSVFVNVNISTEIERERYKSIDDIESLVRAQRANAGQKSDAASSLASPLDAIDKSINGFALLGNPGSGKTTVFKYIALQAAKGVALRGRKRLPIYLAVRDFPKDFVSIVDQASRFLESLDVVEPQAVVEKLLSSGAALLLIDGLDETSPDQQRQIIQELEEIQARYKDSIICISSRPFGLSVALAGFTKWETQALSDQDRILFVRYWFAEVDVAKGQRLVETYSTQPHLDSATPCL